MRKPSSLQRCYAALRIVSVDSDVVSVNVDAVSAEGIESVRNRVIGDCVG